MVELFVNELDAKANEVVEVEKKADE